MIADNQEPAEKKEGKELALREDETEGNQPFDEHD
jgi:hypothetical protein